MMAGPLSPTHKRAIRAGSVAAVALWTCVAAGQQQTTVRIDGKLLACATAYRAAVAQYKAGQDADAASAIARLDRAELRTVVAVLLKNREMPANVADPSARARDPVGPFVWDSSTLYAAGTLHVDLARAARQQSRLDDYRFHIDLAHIVFVAAEHPQPGEPAGVAAHRSALAVALILLLDRNLALAHQYLANATKQWPDDAELLLTLGTVIETEATSPYPVRRAATSNWMRQPRGGAIVLGPLDRERSARVALRRDAARAFERVLAIDDRVEARIRLAHIHVLQKEDESAAALLEQSLAASPSREWEYVARMMLGDVRERAGQLPAATRLYERALTLCPEGQSAYLALSGVMFAAGDREAAEQVLERLFDRHLTVHADDPWWDYTLGSRPSEDALFAKLRAGIPE
jgi:tetratricopeptide (TPR) repeat protein